MTLLSGAVDTPRPVSPALPPVRGPVSAAVIGALRRPPGPVTIPVLGGSDPLTDDDLQLALYCCYELHYRGFAGVDAEWEWWPALLQARRSMERAVEARLRDEIPATASDGRDVVEDLQAVVAAGGGWSLSSYMAEVGTLEQMREFCIHRSAYQLKEADPHTWAIPRLAGGAKAAMVEIQSDEYGAGLEADMHSELFAHTMAVLDLDPAYGAYLPRLPGTTLATVNLVSMFGLHRRWRGALVGHLALFEMTSVLPMGRYSRALERLGLDAEARRFYDVHVAADALHEVIATERMAASLAADEPQVAADIVFGAKAVMLVEATFAGSLLDAWSAGRSSLLQLP